MPAPQVVAIIPARAGSVGVPAKNLRTVGGVPLVTRAVRTARAAASVEHVIVSTDGLEIAAVAGAAGADVIMRPPALSTATASSESALIHALDVLAERGVEPSVVVFLQATSPFTRPYDVDAAIDRVLRGERDVVFAAVETHAFVWSIDGDGQARGVNHNPAYRPMRQAREPQYQETGAFYVLDAAGFRRAGHRFFGRVDVIVTQDATDIDTEQDLLHADALARAARCDSDDARLAEVEAVVTDFDGVHTDDTAKVDQNGVESVTVHRGDGLGVRLLREAGIPVLILSTEQNPVVAARASKLGVPVLHGVDDKAAVLRRWAADAGIRLDRIAYLGNDVNDLGALGAVGWPFAVADAHPRTLAASRRVLSSPGGAGAVRELADLILEQKAAS